MRGNTIRINLEKKTLNQAEESLYQGDYGQRLIIEGLDLPSIYTVHFGNSATGENKAMVGDETGVDIPDEYLATGEPVHVWVFLHAGEDDGETERHGIIKVIAKGETVNEPPTPAQQSALDTAITALESGVVAAQEAQAAAEAAKTAAEGAAAHYPYVDSTTGNWMVWDGDTGAFIDTGYKAVGTDGQPGVGITNIEKTSISGLVDTYTITFSNGNNTTFTVTNGSNGLDGQDATPALITKNYTELTFPVAKDTQCYHDGLLYYAKQDIQTSEAWTAAHWQQTTVEEQQRLLLNAIHGITPDAQQSDIGKALILKTIDQTGKPTAFEYGEAGGGSVDPSVIAQTVDDWCDENFTNPNSPPLDRSLTSSSGAAPADVAGSIDKKINTLFNPDHTSLFEVGSMNTNTGEEVSSTTRFRTKGYIPDGVTAIIPDNGYKFFLFAYRKSDDRFLGTWNGEEFVKSSPVWTTGGLSIPLSINEDYAYRILGAKISNDTVTLQDDAKHINIIWATDQTLSKAGLSADAQKTGDLIEQINGNTGNFATDYDFSILSKGKYDFTGDDFEIGSWSNTNKTANAKRLRIKYLMPVYIGTVIEYDNPTLDFYVAVFSSKKSPQSIENTGWIEAGSSGRVTINHNGYMVIILNGNSDVTTSDYDCTITAVYAVDSVSNPLFFYKTQNQTSIPIDTSALSYSDLMTNTWEAFRTAFSNNVTRNVLTNDTSDTYPIYEYVVTPSEHYTHTVLVAAGMHGDEYEGFWSLYRIMNFLYTMGYKYEKTRNLLRDTKFIIIPVLNPYGVQNRTRGNSAGVNAHENYDVRWNDNTYSRTGTTPFQYNESKAVKLALEAHNDIEMFIEFHTDPYDPDKGNYTEVIETSPLIPMAYNITLDERQNLKNEYNYVYPLSKDWVVYPTKKCNSIRYVEEVWNIPALLMETGIGGAAQSGTAKQMNIAFNWYINCMIQAIKTLD